MFELERDMASTDEPPSNRQPHDKRRPSVGRMIQALTKAGSPPLSVTVHVDGRIEYVVALDSAERMPETETQKWDAAVGL